MRSLVRRRRLLAAALVLMALVAGLAWLLRPGHAAAPAAAAPAPAAGAAPPAALAGPGPVPAAPGAPAVRRRQLLNALQLADHTYCSYRESSKYPHGSRPLAEQPGQAYPNAPVSGSDPMRLAGGGADPGVTIQASQSRVYLAAGESVAFSLRAVDAAGAVLPLVVTRALAQGVTYGASRPAAQVALAFADDGAGADRAPADGAFAALLAPAQTGLASFHGTIRAEVRYSVAGRAGVLLFEVMYSPDLPAAWTGQVREAVEDGSLNFYLKADVRQPGRYIVTGRVDDAAGKPFALATFNDVLPAGPGEVRLTVFGKLLRDRQPALPLTLRDVDGYLLRENADPDRALMPRLEGRAFVGKPHPLTAFSDAEWDSEERRRYLGQFGRDLARARGALAGFDPAALPPGTCKDSPARQNR